MKLDLNSNPAVPLISTKAADSAINAQGSQSKSAATVASTTDRTTFSSSNSGVNALVKQVLSAPEVRQDKIDSARQSISNGTFKFDAAKVADAMIASEKES